MNANCQNNMNHPVPESVTTASVTAKYCSGCGCEEASASAESVPVTTRLVPVTLHLRTETECLHPRDCVELQLTVCNASEYTLICPKLSFCQSGGLQVCNPPVLADLRPHQKVELTVTARADRNLQNPCRLKACLNFCDGSCSCTAQSNELVLPVSRNVGRLKISKSVSPECCITPNDPVCVTLTVQNTGNTPLREVKVVDEIPEGLSYLPHSTRIGQNICIDRNPKDGIILDCLRPETVCTIRYQLKAD